MTSPDLQVIGELRAALPGLRVVMIGMEEDRPTFLQAIREGVAGYVLKDASATEVATAVRQWRRACRVPSRFVHGVVRSCGR